MDPKKQLLFPIPSTILENTIEYSHEFALRLQIEAAALASLDSPQAKALAQAGFDLAGDGNPFPYVLVTRGGGELEDGRTCQVAFLMKSYTEETGAACGAQVERGSVRTFLREWLEEQGTVSPGGNPWR